jgi:hypothetical protein
MKILSRICPICKKQISYNFRSTFLQATRKNQSCKSCSSIQSAKKQQEKRKELWEPIIGYWPIKYRTFVMIRNHWSSLTTKQKIDILYKSVQQRKWYWRHLKRWNRNAGHRKCRITMAKKYSGDNHWMKRPEVLKKIRKTCEKYRGDNHWMKRPEVLKKIRKTCEKYRGDNHWFRINK